MSKRLFVAADIPVSNNIIELSQKLKQKLNNEGIKWVPLHNFHLTLKFLGDTDEAYIPNIINVLQQSISGIKPFDINIKGMGKFSSSGHTKVIWLGVDDNTNSLSNIATQVNKNFVDLGFAFEKRSFKAHLTLARVKYIRNENILSDLIQNYAHTQFQNHTVKEIILYQSILKPAGPVYKPLANFSLFNNSQKTENHI